MEKHQYQPQQLASILEKLQSKKVSGSLHLDVSLNSAGKKISRVIFWKNGQITYGDVSVPDSKSFIKRLEQKLNKEWVDTAVSVAIRQAKEQTSMDSLLKRLVEMQLFSWEEIKTFTHKQIVATLEQVLPYGGECTFNSTTELDLGEGLDFNNLIFDVAQRQDKWSKLAPLISSIESIPNLRGVSVEAIADPEVRKHLQQWVDGKRSVIEIAEGLTQDPLELAQTYMQWIKAGWMAMDGNALQNNTKIPTVLAVDDSAVIQTMIQRSLKNSYRVLLASNAVDALKMVYYEPIDLLLLDVTMPGINGLDLCRTIRSMPQFTELPIIMVTGRDGFFDKMKGKMAGATEYLTKPFDPDKLQELVGRYTHQAQRSSSSQAQVLATT